MARLQYVGARYVPVWYKNSQDDTSNWEINVQYEPLTFVTTQNDHLYLSKKTVPDNIGTPAQNTEYWLDMGTFTGSYASLQDEIDNIVDTLIPGIESDIEDVEDDLKDLQNDLSIRKKRKIIILGDSYNQSSDGTQGIVVTSVGDRIKALYPSMADEIVANWAVGGAGFNVKSGDYTFIEYLDNNYATIDEPESITDMLVFGGYNEIMTTYSNSVAGGTAFCEKVATYFPNCIVHLAFVGWGTRSSSERDKINSSCIPAYQNVAMLNANARLVKNSEYILHTYTLCGTDGVHPTDQGYDVLAWQLGSYLMSGSPIEVYGYKVLQTFTKAADLTGTGSATLIVDRSNEVTQIRCDTNIVFNGTISFSNHKLTIGTINRPGLLNGYDRDTGHPSLSIPVDVNLVIGGVVTNYMGFIQISNDSVTLYCPEYGNTTVSTIDIEPFNFTTMTVLC